MSIQDIIMAHLQALANHSEFSNVSNYNYADANKSHIYLQDRHLIPHSELYSIQAQNTYALMKMIDEAIETECYCIHWEGAGYFINEGRIEVNTLHKKAEFRKQTLKSFFDKHIILCVWEH